MTEAEWLACADPISMLVFLRGKASDRKLRLFACACCRTFWSFLTNIRSREVVEASELYADNLIRRGELRKVAGQAATIFNYRHFPRLQGAMLTASVPATVLPGMSWLVKNDLAAVLLRDMFGNPVRPSPPLPADVLVWNDRTIPRLAQAIYDDRQLPAGTLDNGRLAILADALLDAGCDDEDLMQHCRSEEPHVRGCWAIDLILGKE